MPARGLNVFVNIGAKVGSSVSAAASKVEQRFSAMGRKLKIAGAEMSVALNRFRKASQGVSGLIAAGGFGFTLSRAMGAGSELDHEISLLRNAGRTSSEVAQAIAAANRTIIALPTSTLAGNIAMINETTSAFGSYQHALANVARNQKLAFALSLSAGGHGGEDHEAQTRQIGDLIRTLELRGKANDEGSYKRETEMAYRAMAFTRGRVNGSEFRAFASTGNPIVKTLDPSYLYRIVPSLIQEFGADQAGTMHQALANTILGKVGMGGKRYAEEWARLGLLDPRLAKRAKNGSMTGWQAGAIKGTNVFLQNPLEWVEQTLLPAFARKGVNVDDQTAVQIELSKLVSKTTAARLLGSLVNSNDRKRLHKDAAFIDETPGVDKAYMNSLLNDPKAGVAAIKAATANLLASISGPILIPAARALVSLANGFNRLAVVFENHPGLSKAVSGLVLGLAGLVSVGTIGNLFEFVGAGLGIFATGARVAAGLISPLIGRLAPLRLAMVFARYGMGGLIATLGELAVAFWPVTLAIGAVATGIAILIAKWNGVKAFFAGFGEGFAKALSPQMRASMAHFGKALGDLFYGIGQAIKPVVDWLAGCFGWIGKLFAPANATAWHLAGATFGAVVGGMANTLSGFIDTIANAIARMREFFGMSARPPAMPGAPSAPKPGPKPPHRASGGSVRGGHVYEVNERGQELFMPGRSGTIIPARATAAILAAMSGGVQPAAAAPSLKVGDIHVYEAKDARATAEEVWKIIQRKAACEAVGYLSD